MTLPEKIEDQHTFGDLPVPHREASCNQSRGRGRDLRVAEPDVAFPVGEPDRQRHGINTGPDWLK